MYVNHFKNKLNEITQLETKLNYARDRLQQAWDAHGVTDDQVLKAGRDFDVLHNEYQRLAKKILSI